MAITISLPLNDAFEAAALELLAERNAQRRAAGLADLAIEPFVRSLLRDVLQHRVDQNEDRDRRRLRAQYLQASDAERAQIAAILGRYSG